jgi:hypothetical protein
MLRYQMKLWKLYLHKISIQYNHDKKTIVKKFLNYIIASKKEYIHHEFLNICETVMHDSELEIYNLLKYVILSMQALSI